MPAVFFRHTNMDEPAVSGPAEALSPEPPPVIAPEVVTERMSFSGSGGEYFRIWIVNIALTIVTLGIYSAWAKARRLEYFYRNTRLGGVGFDYHGTPIAILKGRIIGALLFAAYSFSSRLGPRYLLISISVIALVMPFLLNRAFRFRFANSSHRGVRFGFHGSTAEAYRVFLGWPLAALFTLGILWPLAHRRIKQYEHAHASYGRTPFHIDAKISSFYGIYAVAFVMTSVTAFAAGAGFAFAIFAAVAKNGGKVPPTPPPVNPVLMIAIVAVYVIGILATQAFITCRVQSLVWSTTTLGENHSFTCELRAGRFMGILLTNTLATVATLGLFSPFAQVRLAKFMVDGMSMTSRGPLDDVAADPEIAVGAMGEESVGFFDFDIAF